MNKKSRVLAKTFANIKVKNEACKICKISRNALIHERMKCLELQDFAKPDQRTEMFIYKNLFICSECLRHHWRVNNEELAKIFGKKERKVKWV